jgi:hypothetical protein
VACAVGQGSERGVGAAVESCGAFEDAAGG